MIKFRTILGCLSPGAKLWSLGSSFPSLLKRVYCAKVPAIPLTIILACVIGVLGGYGAVLFTFLIDFVSEWTVEPVVKAADENGAWWAMLVAVPAMGLLLVS